MKICFIWIEKFRNFENFCLNLSSKDKFNYDYLSNRLNKIETDEVPDDFFGKRITDVTAIIGKNGTGKSNALELICMILKGAKSKLNSEFFIITQEGDEFICHSRLSKGTPIASFPMAAEDYSGSVSNLKIVYFSNVFDQRISNFDSSVSDISVNNEFLSRRMLRNQVSRVSKQISFINSKYYRDLDIAFPKKIIVTVKAADTRLNSNARKYLYGDVYDKLRTFKSKIKYRLVSLSPESRFISILKFRYFFDVFEWVLVEGEGKVRNSLSSFKESAIALIYSVDAFRTEDITNELLRFIQIKVFSQRNLLEELDEIGQTDFNIEKSIKRLEFLLTIRERISGFDIEHFREGRSVNAGEGFIIDFYPSANNDFWIDFSNLFDGYCHTKLDWLGISSGHQAFLNLFSSIFTELKYSRSENLLLCIDEGDLYLHPKWQQEFFHKLITTLPKICNNKIQLVLTSHSPFLISDLPRQNITILDENSLRHSFDGIELKSKTFGANLYDLYGDAFFLGESKISAFALKKIKDLIDKVESKTTEEDLAETISLIELLGDEVLSFGLKKMVKK